MNQKRKGPRLSVVIFFLMALVLWIGALVTMGGAS